MGEYPPAKTGEYLRILYTCTKWSLLFILYIQVYTLFKFGLCTLFVRNIGGVQRQMKFHLIQNHGTRRSSQLNDYQILLTSSKSNKAKGKEKLIIFKLVEH